LNPSSRLIGKLATVIVPYNFKGNAIRIASNPEDDTDCNKPRYLKDINIVKLIESGEYEGCVAALDNVTDGTALLIEGAGVDETENPSILWGVEASGLRIAGAFDYGIKCVNTNHEISGKMSWKYETSIDALIDGCRTGVYMDHYNNVRISAAIKTRQAYRVNLSNETSLKYAEYGIHLVDSKYIDLRNTRIIDKDPETDTLNVSDEFKHINLDGVCHGLMIENSLCSRTDGFNVRDYIHTTTTENFEGITILGEPSSRFVVERTDSYELYDNCKIDTNKESETYGDLKAETGLSTTSLIPCSNETTIELHGFDFNYKGEGRIIFYKDNNNILFEVPLTEYFNTENYNRAYIESFIVSNVDNTKSTITFEDTSYLDQISCIRIYIRSDKITDGAYIVNDGKTYVIEGRFLKDGIRIKSRFVDS